MAGPATEAPAGFCCGRFAVEGAVLGRHSRCQDLKDKDLKEEDLKEKDLKEDLNDEDLKEEDPRRKDLKEYPRFDGFKRSLEGGPQ